MLGINHSEGLSGPWSGFSKPKMRPPSTCVIPAVADLLTSTLDSRSWRCSPWVSSSLGLPCILSTVRSGRGPGWFSLSGENEPQGVATQTASYIPKRMSPNIFSQIPSSRMLVLIGAAMSTEHTIQPRLTSWLCKSPGRDLPEKRIRAIGFPTLMSSPLHDQQPYSTVMWLLVSPWFLGRSGFDAEEEAGPSEPFGTEGSR